MDNIEALAILAATPQLGSVKIRSLLQHFGSPLEALESDPSDVGEVQGISAKILENWGWWRNDHSWQRNLELAEKQGVRLVPFTDPEYPKRLTRLPDYPILLYIKGNKRNFEGQNLAIVGTRAASTYGKEMANGLASDLASQGFTIVSGLARGIDTEAHKGALQTGATFAVIGSGLGNIYPRENLALADAISEKGALISEFPMETPPDRQNFPQRNRIVSRMSEGIVLVEAPKSSGAMNTMELGWSQGIKLFALPGRADNENFRGNHKLIKEGKAQLVENVEDIGSAFYNLFDYNKISKKSPQPAIPLANEESHLLTQLPNEELSIEDLVLLTKLPVTKLSILLMGLVLKKAIKELPGKVYKKL